jgi:hypothetical protein
MATTSSSLPQPSIGQPVSTEDPKIVNLLSALTTDMSAVDAALTTWKPFVHRRAGRIVGLTSGSTFILNDIGFNATLVGDVNAVSDLAVYLDPADWTAGSRTTQMQLRMRWRTNDVAPGISFTFGLWPVSTWANPGGGQAAIIASVGAQASGSAVALTTPSASAGGVAVSGAFTAPTAGDYILGVQASGSQALSSVVSLVAQLMYRQT